MNLSYWEIKSWLNNVDHVIVGSGIVGLSCALHLKQKYPLASILVLEKGFLPQGASTKNAGFACFGSLSELLDDLQSHSEEAIVSLVKQRYEGLKLLRSTLGDSNIDYQELGGFELFLENDELYEKSIVALDDINSLLKPYFKDNVFSIRDNIFGFEGIRPNYIFNQFEGQIDTGKMMDSLIQKVTNQGIKILNNVTVEAYSEDVSGVKVQTSDFEVSCKKLLIATNGFASQLLAESIQPARAQVLITNPIPDLKIKGTFHLDQGYYYFRNINNRILFGGGRNLDFKTEETTNFGQTELIQDKLETLLKATILPKVSFTIDYRWSGIMGVGSRKKPIVKQISNNTYCGVRLGGMGVAIGSLVGRELADLV
ncbi:MAG: NAD(P)/FAD-dependent oxidoreductase [bacterium]